MAGPLSQLADGSVLLHVKAVPGASREAIGDLVGDRIKIRTKAPPEGGKANAAITQLLAKSLGVRTQQVELRSGHTSREKTFQITGVDLQTARTALNLLPWVD